MNKSDQKSVNFEITDKLKTRALELLDEFQALQFAEGIRLNHAVSNVFAREQERMALKYGKNDPRTNDMLVRMKASAEANTALHARYTEALTPQPDPADGWVVDGFVRTKGLEPVKGVTVAGYDLKGNWNESLGHACTDDTGYFSIAAIEIPEREVPVYLRVSKGKQLFDSSEVQLVPTRGIADRIEIIIGKREDSDDCEPPTGGKGKRMPPKKPAEPAKDISKDITLKEKDEVRAGVETEEKAREEEKKEPGNKKRKPRRKKTSP